MPSRQPVAAFDDRFSDPESTPTSWADVVRALESAELYWLTTVRGDGRPHVTPLIGVWLDGAAHFVTGLDEQKSRNLEHRPLVALTTGSNAWARGLDVVVEGTATRLVDPDGLRRIAEAFESKYGSDWHFDVGDGVLVSHDHPAAGFRIEPSKVLAFAKHPHGQTSYRFR